MKYSFINYLHRTVFLSSGEAATKKILSFEKIKDLQGIISLFFTYLLQQLLVRIHYLFLLHLQYL
jgi:hypothetical protein